MITHMSLYNSKNASFMMRRVVVVLQIIIATQQPSSCFIRAPTRYFHWNQKNKNILTNKIKAFTLKSER